ncbi:MAG: DHH family phosphoesterase [Candidatus Shapirobacteria bacterium]|nr:DHH family phosphoesterase [Candidatus Shapirobacteria bacterium]
MNKKIWSEIKKAKNILLTLHPSPDGDSIGSNLAFFYALSNMGKKVTLISGDSEFPSNFSTLPGADKIIKKNFFDLELSNYDLFIINDIAATQHISRLKEVVFPKNLKTINIDHHFSNKGIADINLIDTSCPSTSQLIFNLFKSNKIKITPDIAACLFIGLYTDTGGFKYSGTTYKTFQIATELTKLYPDFTQLIFDIENNDHPDRLKFLSLILNSIENYLSDSVAIASLDHQSIKDNDLNPTAVSSSDIANLLKSITGWQIGIAVIEYQSNNIKVSFRTRDSSKFDLSQIAAALGGGGHKAAAGLIIKDKSIDEVKKLIVKTIKKIYPNIDK